MVHYSQSQLTFHFLYRHVCRFCFDTLSNGSQGQPRSHPLKCPTTYLGDEWDEGLLDALCPDVQTMQIGRSGAVSCRARFRRRRRHGGALSDALGAIPSLAMVARGAPVSARGTQLIAAGAKPSPGYSAPIARGPARQLTQLVDSTKTNVIRSY